MGWKKHPHKYKWDKVRIDTKKVSFVIAQLRKLVKPYAAVSVPNRLLMSYLFKLEQEAKEKDILIDVTYSAAFEAAEHIKDDRITGHLLDLYDILAIGTLAQDHIEREAIEREWMSKKGIRDA